MDGMTLKQFAIHRFFKLIDEYRVARKALNTPEGKKAFIVVSLALHAQKGQVPKSYWRFATWKRLNADE
jgi:hypothetical protein